MADEEGRDVEQVAQFVMKGQGEDVSGGQSEDESSHSIERNDEYAQFHTSPGPSRHLDPIPGGSDGLASGVDPSDTETIDYGPAAEFRKTLLDSD
eukprot:5651841-Pyramimonas_sp.AAC.2